MSDTLDSPFTIMIPPVVATEASWKQEASKTLQVFGRSSEDADSHAEELYQTYVVERGFSDYDYREDPYCAVLDDHDYVVPASRYKKAPITA